MNRTVIFLCLLGLLLSPHAWGQIVISSNEYAPAPGTAIGYSFDADLDSAYYSSLTAGSGGPMVWDFSSRIFDPGYSQYSVNLATIPSIDSFPGANLAFLTVAGSDTIWTISKSQSNAFGALGMVHHSVLGQTLTVYKNTAPEFVFPLALGNQWISFRHWKQTNGMLYTDIFDTTKLSVDAWGTAHYGSTSIPCLRIMAHQTTYKKTYYSSDILVDSMKTDIYAVYFVAAGFDLFASACKSVSPYDTSYSLTATDDFLKSPTDVASDNGTLPSDFVLGQNYPNPFNPTTTIEYSLPRSTHVTLEIFDILGRNVRTLIDRNETAGTHRTEWNGLSNDGRSVASGVYVYRIQVGESVESKKMLLVK